MKFIYLFLLTLMLIPAGLSAQEGNQEEPVPLLPDINPQDIEIRGEFRARFPGINRQPILGFNPTPRVYRIDPNRMPFLETPEEVVASVPLSQLEAQIGPPRDFFDYPDKSAIFGYLGYGMFNSPEAEVYSRFTLNEHTSLYSNVHFAHSEGHLDETNFTDGRFRRLNGEFTVKRDISHNSDLLVNLRGRSDFTQLYFAGQDAENLSSSVHSGGVGAAWTNAISAFDQWVIHGGVDYTVVDLFFTPNPQLPGWPPPGAVFLDSASDMDEIRLSAGGYWSAAGRRIGTVHRVESDVEAGFYNHMDESQQWFLGGAAYYWRNEVSRGGVLKLGMRAFYGYDEISKSVFRGYPYIAYNFTTQGGLRLSAEFSGEMSSHGLEENFVTNRSSFFGGPVAVTQRIYGNANAELDFGTTATLYGQLHSSYFSRPRMYTSTFGSWTHPKELILVQPGAGISLNIAPRYLMVYSEAHLNLRFFDDSVYSTFQHMEDWRLTGGVRASPMPDFIITSWLDVIGPRKQEDVIFNQTYNGLGHVFLLNAKAEYRFGGVMGVYIKALNILGQEYVLWPGLEERPLQIYGGITFNLPEF